MSAGTDSTDEKQIQQVVTWFLEGAPEPEILLTIKGTWPGVDADTLIELAQSEIEDRGGWHLAALSHLYKKQMQYGELADAARTLKEIGLHTKKEEPPKPSPRIELIDPNKPGPDLRLLGRALREGWQLPQEIMAELPLILTEMARTGDAKTRILAIRALLTMQSQNIKLKPTVKKVQHSHRHKLATNGTPSTEGESFDDRKRRLLARATALVDDGSGSAGG